MLLSACSLCSLMLLLTLLMDSSRLLLLVSVLLSSLLSLLSLPLLEEWEGERVGLRVGLSADLNTTSLRRQNMICSGMYILCSVSVCVLRGNEILFSALKSCWCSVRLSFENRVLICELLNTCMGLKKIGRFQHSRLFFRVQVL